MCITGVGPRPKIKPKYEAVLQAQSQQVLGGMWSCRVYGKLVSPRLKDFEPIPEQLTSDSEIKHVITIVNTLNICPGNPEHKDLDVKKIAKKPVYLRNYPDHSTIRHNSCSLLTADHRCGPCRIYRSSFAASFPKASTPLSSQYVPYAHLSRATLQQRLSTSTKNAQKMKRKNRQIRNTDLKVC